MPVSRFPTEAHAEADELLKQLGETEGVLKNLLTRYEEDMAKVRRKYEKSVQAARESKADLERELEKLAKKHKADLFFTDDDRCDLKHGALLYRLERKVKRIKGMLETLESLGITGPIKIAKSVDWDKLEAWPEPELERIGTKRVAKEKIEFEVY